MIFKSAGLPGLTLKAWVIFDWATNTILAKSDSVVSVTGAGTGERTVNVNAGTFSSTAYLLQSLSNNYTSQCVLSTKTLTTALVQQANTVGTPSNPAAGERTTWYFYEF